MNDGEIKDIESLKKLREDAQNLMAIKKVWPLLKPFAKLLGVDTEGIDDTFKKIPELDRQIQELTVIPDKFNNFFSTIGWTFFETMKLETAKEAIRIAENDSVEKADNFLAEHFSPDWVETHLIFLKFIKGFQPRLKMAEMALEDYKAGRYYASVLVTLSLIDGWVNELNIVDYQRYGFFSEKSHEK